MKGKRPATEQKTRSGTWVTCSKFSSGTCSEVKIVNFMSRPTESRWNCGTHACMRHAKTEWSNTC
ncbi:MAG: hypothetical protein EXS38_03095 [Opitutus sp.]|nr:hypothetical protein [Opitutus sp.]